VRKATLVEDLFDTLWHHAQFQPEAPAILDPERPVRWEELPDRAERLCLGLVRCGMRPGRGVALLLRRTRHLPLTFLAILRGRAVAVPLDPSFGREHLQTILQRSRPEVLVYDAAHSDLARQLAAPGTFRRLVRVGEPPPGTPGPEGKEIPWRDLLTTDAEGAHFPELPLDAILYHHWTLEDEAPAAALGTLRSLILSAHSADRMFGFRPEDRHLCLLSPNLRLFDHALRPLLSGGAAVCVPGQNVRRLAEAVRDHGVTVLQGPAYLYRLLCEWVAASGQELPGLRVLQSCGHTAPWVRRRVREVLGAELLVTWAALESLGAALGPRRDSRGVLRHGQPAPGILVRITDAGGEPVLEEAVGELRLRGGALAPTRFAPGGEEKRTREANGSLRTGMLVRYSMAGEIELLGRPEHRLERGGQTVYLRETERCLETHRRVMEAAVVAVPRGGRRPAVVAVVQVEPQQAPSADDLKAYLARRLHPSQLPDHVVAAKRLPHLPLGRLDRAGLARRLRTLLA
jgi:acyl-CoA synthetase (AMP-forming)/AMP-acid ligase II